MEDLSLNKDTSLSKEVKNPIWVSVSEAAKLGGVQSKTIRRAIKSEKLRFKIVGNRYLIDFRVLVLYLNKSKKLLNKLNLSGIGQYIKEWKK